MNGNMTSYFGPTLWMVMEVVIMGDMAGVIMGLVVDITTMMEVIVMETSIMGVIIMAIITMEITTMTTIMDMIEVVAISIL